LQLLLYYCTIIVENRKLCRYFDRSPSFNFALHRFISIERWFTTISYAMTMLDLHQRNCSREIISDTILVIIDSLLIGVICEKSGYKMWI